MGASQSKKVIKTALKKRRMDSSKKGTRRGKTGVKRSPAVGDVGEPGPSCSPNRDNGSRPLVGVNGGGSSSTLSSASTSASCGSALPSSLPVAKGQQQQQKKIYCSDAFKLNENVPKNTTTSDITTPKKTVFYTSKKMVCESSSGRQTAADEAKSTTPSKRHRSNSSSNKNNNRESSKCLSIGTHTIYKNQRTHSSSSTGSSTNTPGSRPAGDVITAFGSKFCKSPAAGKTSRIGGRTATVTPAIDVIAPTTKKTAKPLPRFGFRDIKSGDSTDSVNSILSDALTGSDTNSNILDYYEEQNANSDDMYHEVDVKKITRTMNRKNNTLSVQNYRNDVRSRSISRCDDVIVHSSRSPASPSSISQASSGVTSAVVTAKLRAHTHQLPEPQLPSVRSFGARKQLSVTHRKSTSPATSSRKRPISFGGTVTNNYIESFKPHAATSSKSSTCVRSCPVTFKTVTSAAIVKSSSTTLSLVEHKERESPKSINTLDSGLGSSMEGDKLRTASVARNIDQITPSNRSAVDGADQVAPDNHRLSELVSAGAQYGIRGNKYCDIKEHIVRIEYDKDCKDVTEEKSSISSKFSSNDKEDVMKASLVDESDKWLREKNNKMGTASKLQTGFTLKPANRSPSSTKSATASQDLSVEEELVSKDSNTNHQSEENNPEESELHITYGKAREKFSVYERNRFGYQSDLQSTSTNSKVNNKTKLSKAPSDPGSRRLPTTLSSQSKLTRVHSVGITRMTNMRPTSIIKAPILVTPVSNETVELSRPVLKRLEYSESTDCKNGNDVQCADRIRHRKNSNEDFLMVSCLERPARESVEEDIPDSDVTALGSRDIEFNKKLNHKSNISYIFESPPQELDKHLQTKLETFSLESPSKKDYSATLVSPDSESSFEVLESPNDALDYADGSTCTAAFYNDQAVAFATSNEIPTTANPSHRFTGVFALPISVASSAHVCHKSNVGDNTITKKIEELASSLEKSSLVASLTTAVLAESLEESAAHKSCVSDPIDFYKIAVTFNTSASSDTATYNTAAPNPATLVLTPVTIKTGGDSNDQSDIVVMENYLNNLNISKVNGMTESVDNAFQSHKVNSRSDGIYSNKGVLSPIKRVVSDQTVAIDSMDDNANDIVQSRDCHNARDILNSTSADIEAMASPPYQIDMLISCNNVMNTSSVFSEANSSNCCSPALNRNKCSNTNSADIDHDFLIDDEISDQPDLTFAADEMCGDQAELGYTSALDGGFSCRSSSDFLHHSHLNREDSNASIRRKTSKNTFSGYQEVVRQIALVQEDGVPTVEEGAGGEAREEDLVTSLFTDEVNFAEDLYSPSPCQAVRRVGVEVGDGERSDPCLPRLLMGSPRTPGGTARCRRPDSVCTLASSLDPEDFMLDFDAEDFSQRCVSPPYTGAVSSPSLAPHTTTVSSNSSSPHQTPLKRSLLSRPTTTTTTEGSGHKPTRLPVPRQPPDSPDGQAAFHQQLLQDCQSTKSMLLKLRTVLLNADTADTFAYSTQSAGCPSPDLLPPAPSPPEAEVDSLPQLRQQNTDLRRQVYLLQQQLAERDRAMRCLQDRLAPADVTDRLTQVAPDNNNNNNNNNTANSSTNAATQTDRTGRLTASLHRPSSVDDGLGPTVSFRLGKVHVF